MLTDKIAADMKDAMRAKDAPRLSTLRMLKSVSFSCFFSIL